MRGNVRKLIGAVDPDFGLEGFTRRLHAAFLLGVVVESMTNKKKSLRRKAREVWLHPDRQIAYGYQVCTLQTGESCGSGPRAILFREVPPPRRKA